MKRFSLLKLLLLLLVLMLALAGTAMAGTLTDAGLDLPGASVHYPKYEGENAADINALLVEGGHIHDYLDRAALMVGSQSPLTVTWQAADDQLTGDVASVVFTAAGPLTDTRVTHAYHAVTVDLRDGHRVTMEELFSDPESAVALMEEIIEYDIAPDMSAHLSAMEAVPLPEDFTVDASGITLYYPISRLSTLTDKAGSIRLGWHLLRDVLDLREGSILQRIGVKDMLTLQPEKIGEMTAQGRFPFIPMTLGDSVAELTEKHGLLYDPDLTRDNRLFQLEGAAFRKVYLLTDTLTESWDKSVVQGIRADELCAFGLMTGVTKSADWHQQLGEPEHSLTVDEETA
ncbi:MAG: hypothetical protein Q4C54_01900 [Clostridia bacterium]|nr:hypothetical protein [Clostridia bacterium]